MKKIVIVGVVTGVVMYTFFRSLSKKVSDKLQIQSPESPSSRPNSTELIGK